MNRERPDAVAVIDIKENAVEPTRPFVAEFRIMFKDLRKRLKLTRMDRMFVFRHQQNFASVVNADLVGKFVKGFRVRKIDDGVRFTAMTVAAGYKRFVDRLGKFD